MASEVKVREHSRRVGRKLIRVRAHTREGEYAPGIPLSREISAIPSYEGMAKFVVHEHHAKRAGKHFDLRLALDGKAHSWAIRHLPKPGEVRLAVQQPTHTVQYMDFTGEIVDGYGAGKVGIRSKGSVEVLESSNNKVVFNRYVGKDAYEYVMLRTKGNKWLILNRTTTPEKYKIPRDKPKYKSLEFDDNLIDTDGVMQPKIDGAHAIVVLEPNKIPRVFSYREGKKRKVIEYTHKIPGLNKKRVPPGVKSTMLRAEVYLSDKSGKALPVERTAGVLNSGVGRARDLQKGTGGLKIYPFSYVNKNQEKSIKDLMPLSKSLDFLQIPDAATTKKEKELLIRSINDKKHPLTSEGVVLWKDGVPHKAKIVDDKDVYVRKVFAGKGKYEGNAAGGFYYSRTPDGPVVGKVGGGMTDKFRRELWKNKDKAEGRVATLVYNAEKPSGALFAPRFLRWHPEKDRGNY
jgi:hypothetical protein